MDVWSVIAAGFFWAVALTIILGDTYKEKIVDVQIAAIAGSTVLFIVVIWRTVG